MCLFYWEESIQSFQVVVICSTPSLSLLLLLTSVIFIIIMYLPQITLLYITVNTN